jgi:hypothetical protein
MDPIAPLGRVAISPENFTTKEVEAIRLSAVRPAPTRLDDAVGPLLARLGLRATSPEVLATTVASSLGATGSDSDGSSRSRYGTDPLRNRAVETRAVSVVTEWYESRGWTVTSRESEHIGYDLDCTTPDGTVRHVEVKGTSGPGDDVLVSSNEVRFAADNPSTAVLAIVAGIVVVYDTGESPRADGGELVHNGSWTNLPGGLVPTGYTYTHSP